MSSIALLGIIAGVLGISSFLPQVIKVYQTKHTKDLSRITFTVLAISGCLWIVYGILRKDFALIFTNTFITLLVVLILIEKIKHG